MVSEPMAPDPIQTPPNESSTVSTLSSSTQEHQLVMLTLPISTKLDRDNYLSWHSQIVSLLHGYGLFRFLESPAPTATITTDTGAIQSNPDFLPWYKQDQMLLGWLRSSLNREILAQVVSAKTSADLWNSLQKSFSATSKARLSELRRKLQNTVKGGSSCLEFVQKLRSVADELSFIGEPVSDEDFQRYLLQGLSQDFDPFVIGIHTGPSRPTVDLMALLFSHESLLNSRIQPGSSSSLPSVSNPSAHYATRPNYNQKNSKNNQKSRGPPNPFQNRPSTPLLPTPSQPRAPGANYRPPAPSQNSYRPPGSQNIAPAYNPNSRPYNPDRNTICQICSKRGHAARDCWYRYDAEPESTSNFQAFVAQPTSVNPTSDWYLDLGASHHVTNDLNNISSFLPYEGFDSLQIGDGSGPPHINPYSSRQAT